MRGVRGVEVTDEGVRSTDLEIFETGAKIPAWPKKKDALKPRVDFLHSGQKGVEMMQN